MKIKQIASAYGVTVSAVNKWPKSKRYEAIRNLQSGVNPIIAELVGELQRECYVASCYNKSEVVVLECGGDAFDVYVGFHRKIQDATLNPSELQAAIDKVRSLYK